MEKQLPRNGQKLSKKEIQEINAQQEAQAKENKIKELGNQRIQEFANSEIYEGMLPTQVSEILRSALRHFSDLILKMPYETYRSLAMIDDGKYTYQQFDIAMQILSMANAEQIDFFSIAEYIIYKDELQIVAGQFATALDEHKQRIRKEVEI